MYMTAEQINKKTVHDDEQASLLSYHTAQNYSAKNVSEGKKKG